MKNIARTAILFAAFGSAASAAPFLAIGDGAELFVVGTLGVRSDDNVLLTSTKETSDTIFDINPGIEITFGKNAALSGSLSLVDAFANYTDNSALNTQLFSGDFTSKYEDAKLKMKFSTGYHELNQNIVGATNLNRRDEFVVGAGAEVEVSQITSVGAAVNFNHTNYHNKTQFGDSDDLSVPLNFYYKYTAKLDLSVGYRYRDYQVSRFGNDSTDHFFNVGARGELTEKLNGTLAVGVTTRHISGVVSGGSSETLPGAEATLSYELTPKTSILFGASNDFGTAPQGQQQKNFAINLGFVSNIDSQWSVNANVSHRSIEYYKAIPSRTDDYFEGTVGAAYVVNTFVTIKAAYYYRNNDSDLATSGFTNNVFSLSASVRY